VSLLSRFTTFIKAKFSAFLDRNEDPGETLDYAYQQQLEQLQNLMRAIAEVMTSEKRLELLESQIQGQIMHLDEQARLAMQQGREDLARAALERKVALQQQVSDYATRIEQLKAQEAKFVDMESRLRQKVEAFRTQKEMIKANYSSAQAQVKIQESVTGISEEMGDVQVAVQRAQDRVDQMQSRAQAMDALIGAGTFPEVGSLETGQDDIDRQLSQLSSKAQVDAQFAQMKAQMQGKLSPPDTAPPLTLAAPVDASTTPRGGDQQ
jgi:phage shock protein A